MTTKTNITDVNETITAVKAAEMRADGASYVAIGKALGFSDKKAKTMVERGNVILAERDAEQGSGGRRKDYGQAVTEEVVRMREEDAESWATIAEELSLGTPGKARRVYRNAKGITRGAPLGRFEKGGRLADHNEYAPEAIDAGLVSEGDAARNAEILRQRDKEAKAEARAAKKAAKGK